MSVFFAETKHFIKQQFSDLWHGPSNSTKGTAAIADKYGWQLVIYRLAETKLFDMDGKDSIQSAEDADLYRAFEYLARQNAIERVTQQT